MMIRPFHCPEKKHKSSGEIGLAKRFACVIRVHKTNSELRLMFIPMFVGGIHRTQQTFVA